MLVLDDTISKRLRFEQKKPELQSDADDEDPVDDDLPKLEDDEDDAVESESDLFDEQSGEGMANNDGLSTSEIQQMMSPYKNFAGVYPSDIIKKIKPTKKKFGFIMNTDPSTKKGDIG